MVVKESTKRILKEATLNPKEAAYQLNVMLGTIHDEMLRGGDATTLDEVKNLYEYASIINNYFEDGY